MTPSHSRCLVVLLAPLLLANPAVAQFVPQPTPNADRLAEQMRVLAANPRDVYALIQAGELSTRLEDTPAAMAFFTRAAAIDPSNPRIAAGRAGAFVLLERPGEALRLYAQAERAGVAMAPYLLQRGLAYDLTGQPGHAQRDYRAVLARGPDDEATRRLALSLGIVGRRDEALAVLDPLLRRSDRAAWRARACILALGGDPAGGEKIAANMMQGGQALGPFLRRLPALSIADRAFAVHFGDVASTPARQLDARLAPAVAPLPSVPPLALASVLPPVRAGKPNQRMPSQSARVTPRQAPGRVSVPVVAAVVPQPHPPAVAAPTPAPAQLAVTATPVPTPATSRTPSPLPYQVFTPPARAVVPQPIPMTEPATPPPVQAVAAALIPDTAVRPRAGLDSIIGTIVIPEEELAVRPVRIFAPAAKPLGSKPPVAVKARPDAEKTKPDPPKADPARWWAQVASGARVADLDTDWRRLASKSPTAFRGKAAWTMPLRATNRLLAGPFKTQQEAQGFVNIIGKDGLSAFAWQSEAGQAVARLALD